MNRGIDRRTVFETRDDVRAFLAGMARAARRGEVEVHCYCVMTTHYHALVRSPLGMLSEAMRRIQNRYVRRFNRLRRRDGPLFRGRFRSKRVESLTYRHTLVRYIDANSVSAGVVQVPGLYPYGSAHRYVRGAGPPWLERAWIEASVRCATGRAFDATGYAATLGGPMPSHLRELVELRIAGGQRGPDPLDDLVNATPEAVLSWMRRKALLADGSGPGLAVCDPTSVAEAIRRGKACHGPWRVRQSQKPVDGWSQAHAGLLLDLCGLTMSSVAGRLDRSESGVGKMRVRHRRGLIENGEYAARVRELALEALELCGLRGPAGRTVVGLS